MRPCHNVANQLKTLIPLGNAISIVETINVIATM